MLNAIAVATLVTLFALTGSHADELTQRRNHNWHQWRGPRADGIAPHGDPPLRWDEKTNVKWKTPIPGEGSATPIVWEDQVFIATAIPTDRVSDDPPQPDEQAKTRPPENIYQYAVIALDRETGEERWRRVAVEAAPHEGRHSTNSYASASPTTDGERLYVSFGSRGIFCFDLDGKLLWKRDLGDMRTRYGWGEAASPAVHAGALVVNWDHEDDSFLVVLDARTGETRWKADRDEPSSWATPLIVEHAGRAQVVVNGTNRVRSYDLATGKIIWQCGGQTLNAIPSPLAADGIVFCLSGYRGAAAYAIPLDSEGDITGTAKILWTYNQATPYVPSPILHDGRLYFTRHNTAILTCLDAATGKLLFGPERLPGLTNVYASPVAAQDRIYFTGRDGATTVIHSAPELEVLAVNRLDEPIDASPAIVGRELFLRGKSHVYCLNRAQIAR